MAKGKKTGGRVKGVPNKITADLKGMILDALDREGGVLYLQNVAVKDRRAFCGLLGRVLPMTVIGDPNAPLIPDRIEVRLVGGDG